MSRTSRPDDTASCGEPGCAGKEGTWIDLHRIPDDLSIPEFLRREPRLPTAAARLDIPASELDNVTPFEIELEKHEMSRPRKIYGFLWGTVVSELPSPGNA